MKIKIVAVNGSLVPGGNVDALLEHALEEFAGDPRFEVRKFALAGLDVGPCRQCNWCLKNQAPGRYCGRDDGMTAIYPELMEAGGLIVASPVHFGRLSGTTADFLDRLRVFVHGNLSGGGMRNKVGGALAVSWFRNAGLEQTLITINTAFHVLSMVVAAPDLGIHGAAAFSSLEGAGGRDGPDRLLVKRDDMGMASARSVARRVAELTILLRAGRQALDRE